MDNSFIKNLILFTGVAAICIVIPDPIFALDEILIPLGVVLLKDGISKGRRLLTTKN